MVQAALTGPLPAFLPLHGLGGAKDLPIPLELAIAGATAALIVSFCVLALAWRTPRYEDPRPGIPVPRIERVVDDQRFQWTAADPRAALRRLPDLGADLGAGPGHQPGARHVLRAGLGRDRPRLAAARSGRQSGQPGSHAQPAAREGHRWRPLDRVDDLSREARLLARSGRAVRVHLAGAGQPAERLSRIGAGLAGGVPRHHADRRRGVRRRVAGARRPVRGVLHPARAPVGLGT